MAESPPASSSTAPPPSLSEVKRKLSVHTAPSKNVEQGPPSADPHNKSPVLRSQGQLGPIHEPDSEPHEQQLQPQHPQAQQQTQQPQQQQEISPIELAREIDERVEGARNLDRQAVIKTGYLYKKGERRKVWQKRFFVLRPQQLAYYKDEREYKLLRDIPIDKVRTCAPVELKKHDHVFAIVTPERTYYVEASNDRDVQEWVYNINDVIASQGPSHTASISSNEEFIQQQQQQQHEPQHQHEQQYLDEESAQMPTMIKQQQYGTQPSDPHVGAPSSSLNIPTSTSAATTSTATSSVMASGMTTQHQQSVGLSTPTPSAPIAIPANSGANIPTYSSSYGNSSIATGLSDGASSFSSHYSPTATGPGAHIHRNVTSATSSTSRDRSSSPDNRPTSPSRLGDTIRSPGHAPTAPPVSTSMATSTTASTTATSTSTTTTTTTITAAGGSNVNTNIPTTIRSASPGAGSMAGITSSDDEDDDFVGEMPSKHGIPPAAAILPATTTAASTPSSPQPSPVISSQKQQQPQQVQQLPPPQQQQHQIPPLAITDPNKVILSGYLTKQGKRKNWRKRWFILVSTRLIYCKSHMDQRNPKQIDLSSILDAVEYEPPVASSPRLGGRPMSQPLGLAPPPVLTKDSSQSSTDGTSSVGASSSLAPPAHIVSNTGAPSSGGAGSGLGAGVGTGTGGSTSASGSGNAGLGISMNTSGTASNIGSSGLGISGAGSSSGSGVGLSTGPSIGVSSGGGGAAAAAPSAVSSTSGTPSTTNVSVARSASTAKRYDNCFKIITAKRTFLVCAPTEEDEIKWLSALRVLISASRQAKEPKSPTTPNNPPRINTQSLQPPATPIISPPSPDPSSMITTTTNTATSPPPPPATTTTSAAAAAVSSSPLSHQQLPSKSSNTQVRTTASDTGVFPSIQSQLEGNNNEETLVSEFSQMQTSATTPASSTHVSHSRQRSVTDAAKAAVRSVEQKYEAS